MPGPMHYFAYGSNMLTRRLQARVPSAQPVGIGHVSEHRLRWHMPARDGSAKCDAEATGRAGDVVWGVLFRIHADEKRHLDEVEALGVAYRDALLKVCIPGGSLAAFAYLALNTADNLKPYDWYKGFVVAGAIEHGLPGDYLRALRAVDALPDPDPRRSALNRRLLESR